MGDLQKNILLSMISINTKITALDSSYVTDLNLLLATSGLIDSDLTNINETLISKLLNIAEKNWEFVATTVMNTTLISKLYISLVAKNTNVLNSVDKIDLTKYVTDFIAMDISSLTSQQEYELYNMIVKMSIFANNAELTKTIIDKIQSL